MSPFLPGYEMQEARNKLETFRLFAYVDQELHFPPRRLSLKEMVRLAQALPAWKRSFALEGVAHYYVGGAKSEGPFTSLLADPDLPESAMVPMHAGMGTAFAEAALAGLANKPAKEDLRHALDGFFELCHANSRPGWHENSIEAMGLTVRTLHPHLLRPVSEAMGEIDPNAQRLLWHGVGRSLYFVPMNFITFGGSHERALAGAISEAPTPEDRCNAVAGLVWAVTLVNIRHPAVLEHLLRKCRTIGMPAAVTNGVVSALMVWKHMVPGPAVPDKGDVLAPYLRSASPAGIHGGVWNDLVAVPAAQAFAEIFPLLTEPAPPAHPTIASLFRYREAKASQA